MGRFAFLQIIAIWILILYDCDSSGPAFATRVRSQLYESTPGELIRRLNALAEEKVERVQQFFAKSQGDVLEVEWTDFLFSEASKYAALRCYARTLCRCTN